jgi:hypothetical protein
VLQSDLPTADRLVLVTMVYHADRLTLQCRLSASTIARETGLGRRAVYNVVGRLEALGWLSRSQQGRRGRKASNVYTLNLEPKPPAGIVNGIHHSETEQEPGIGNDVLRMVNDVPNNGEYGSLGIGTCIEPVRNRAPDGGAALEDAPPPAPKTLPEQARQLAERFQLKTPRERDRLIAERLGIRAEDVPELLRP